MDVPREEDLGEGIDDEPVGLHRGDGGPHSVGSGKQPAFQHLLHDLARPFVTCPRDEPDHVVDCPAVIHQDPDALEIQQAGVLDEGAVRRERPGELRGDCRLRFGHPDDVVVPRGGNDLDPGGQVPEHFAEDVVLLVDILDRQFVLLSGIDADAVDEIARDQEVAGVGVLEPVGEPVPRPVEEGVAPDVDVGDEDRLSGPVALERGVVDGDVGAEKLLGEEEPPVVREFSLDSDHLVKEDPLGFRESVALPLIEEHPDGPGRVLHLDEPVPLGGRPDVGHHPDDAALLVPVAVGGFDQRLDRHRGHPAPHH